MDSREALQYLKRHIKKGNIIYFIYRDVSKSGMTRYLDAYVIKRNRPVYLSSAIAKVLDNRWDRNKGIVVRGTGFSAAHDIAYNLSYALFGNGGQLRYETL